MAQFVLTIDLEEVKKGLDVEDELVYEVSRILEQTCNTLRIDRELTFFAFASPCNESDDAPAVGSVVICGGVD